MHITRLVKSESGGASFETIDDPAEVIKLAGRRAPLDIVEQFAVETARDEAFDNTTRLAVGAGFDALRDAGIPLVMRYKTTTLGTQLPDRWGLPDSLRDDTGVIFASAFPGYDRFADDVEAYTADRARREHLLALEGVRSATRTAPSRRRRDRSARSPTFAPRSRRTRTQFDRRFLFRVLSMGHSQFAELIGARGPNTQVNAACASTTQAVVARRGLDSCRALPPRDRRVGRRRHGDSLSRGSPAASSPVARPQPTSTSRMPRPRSIGVATG